MQITKQVDKPHVISYIRDDGTVTWMHASDFFVQHDLSHYALEKLLGYTTAFMGMLNKGMEVKDFEDREKRKQLTITQEGWYAENMANLFLMEAAQGNFDDFNEVSKNAFKSVNKELPPPVLTDEQLNAVRSYYRELLSAWNNLPAGDTMSLTINC